MPDNNPWIAQHMQGEMDYTGNGYSRRTAAALVRSEYAGAPDPVACACGGKAHYRATVGAMQCPSCRKLYHSNGEAV